MTPLELRIKYKSITGFPPTYGRTLPPKSGSCNFKGDLTHEYAEWLEEYAGDYTGIFSMKCPRIHFLQDTCAGTHATYYDKNRNLRYVRAYKEWLEELLCKVLITLNK